MKRPVGNQEDTVRHSYVPAVAAITEQNAAEHQKISHWRCRRAILERLTPDLGHRVRDVELRQGATALECAVSDFLQPRGQPQFRQRGAVLKCTVSDFCNGIRNIELHQRTASCKRVISDPFQLCGQPQLLQCGAAAERTVSDFCSGIRKRDLFQRTAIIEQPCRNDAELRQKHDLFQLLTSIKFEIIQRRRTGTKRIRADVLYPLRNDNGLQTAASGKCPNADVLQTFGKRNSFQCAAPGKRIV